MNVSVLQPAQAAVWVTNTPMPIGRYHHTATLLFNGQVLVAGGYFGPTASAELFNPATGAWTNTGSMNIGRAVHTATLLLDGKVLVAGGAIFSGNGYYTTNSAELYDPSNGIWTVTGSMASNRQYHTSTLLPNGKVLVAGGENDSGILSSAELYDPTTGMWTNTGSMNVKRTAYTATLLPNGEVLIAGGSSDVTLLLPTELYDPNTGTWTNTGAMNLSRDEPTATLLPNGKVLVAGGVSGPVFTNLAELYDPVTGTWAETGALNIERKYHVAALLPDGKVLVAGGLASFFEGGSIRGEETASAELYDPVTETWTSIGSMNSKRRWFTATLLRNGNVLVAGDWSLGIFITESYTSTNLTVTAISLTNPTTLPSSSFQFSFTNMLNESFSVLSTTNLSFSMSNWTVLSGVKEFPPGQYQFLNHYEVKGVDGLGVLGR